MGPNGVESRLYEACVEIGKLVDRISPGVEPEQIVMDVFDFSRGAAAARYFFNRFRQGFVEYRENYGNLKRASLPRDRKVRFRFVGAFDTVAAIGIGSNYCNGPVNAHLKTVQAQEIFHLTTSNEYRKNFRLNHNLPGGGGARALPGAHSGIGGGYRNTGDEVNICSPRPYIFSNQEAAEAHRQHIIQRGQDSQATDAAVWVTEGRLDLGDRNATITYATPVKMTMQGSRYSGMRTTYGYVAVKRLSHPRVQRGLSRIALKIMYDRAMAAGEPLLSLPGGGEYDILTGLRASPKN